MMMIIVRCLEIHMNSIFILSAWEACKASGSEFIFDELTFFRPKPSLYIVDPEAQRGVHCRFGMRGVIAGKL